MSTVTWLFFMVQKNFKITREEVIRHIYWNASNESGATYWTLSAFSSRFQSKLIASS